MKERHLQIRELLSEGKCTAIHLNRLSEILGIDTRAIKKAVQDMRLNGEPVLSSPQGYYISSCPEEVEEFIGKMEAVGHKTLKVAKAMKRR